MLKSFFGALKSLFTDKTNHELYQGERVGDGVIHRSLSNVENLSTFNDISEFNEVNEVNEAVEDIEVNEILVSSIEAKDDDCCGKNRPECVTIDHKASSILTEEYLLSLRNADLKQMASERGLGFKSKSTKAQLVDIILTE